MDIFNGLMEEARDRLQKNLFEPDPPEGRTNIEVVLDDLEDEGLVGDTTDWKAGLKHLLSAEGF